LLNEKNIVKIIAVGPVIFIPLIVIIISIFIAIEDEKNFSKNIAKLESELIYAQRKAVRARVDSVVSYIEYEKSVIKKTLTFRIKKRVDNAYKIAHNIYNEYKEKKSDKEIKNLIVTALNPLSWNEGESSIRIIDDKGALILAPKYMHQLKNKSNVNFQEEIAICKNKKEGLLWNLSTKADKKSTEQFQQVSFVKTFDHYGWCFALSEYLDTAQKKADQSLLTSLSKMYELSDDYIIVNNMHGDILLNPTIPDLIGKNVYDIDNPLLMAIYEKTKKLLSKQESGFGSYTWVNQATKEEDIKHSYVRKIKNSDWLVASGYYESTIKNQVAKKSVELYKSHNIQVRNLLVASVIFILLSLVVSYIIAGYIKKSYIKYENRITYKTKELKKLNETLEHRVKERTKELEKLTQELEVLATTDSLTHVHNRYSIMKILNAEINRSKRYNKVISIIMYDVDYFKNINDEYGHDVGDKVLYEVTTLVKNSLRDMDSIGRYGGEEFLIIMPETSLDNAKEIASRVRKEIQKHNFNYGIKLTVSLGLVELSKNEDANSIFKRLDKLLYDSKNSGRNKLSF